MRRLRNYKKPEFPPKFYIIDSTGLDDGPFYASNLVRSDLPGKPWVIAQGGQPKVFRLKRQRGNILYLEDGRVEVVAL